MAEALKPPRATARRVGRIAAIASAAVIAVCIAGGGILLHTETGTGWAVALAERALSDDTMTVRIDRPGGHLGDDLSLGAIDVSDRAGVFLRIDEMRLQWRPLALLTGSVDVEALSIRRVAILREPDLPAADASPVVPSPQLPGFNIRVARLDVAEVALAPAVFGDAYSFAVSAAAEFDAGSGQTRLQAELSTLDGSDGSAVASVDYSVSTGQLSAEIRVAEPNGGVVSRLAGLPARTPLDIRLSGDGPGRQWPGKFAVRAGDLLAATADLRVALDRGRVHLDLDGSIQGGTALGPKFGPQLDALARSPAKLHASIDYDEAAVLTLTDLQIRHEALNVSASGTLDTRRQTVRAKMALTSEDGALLAAIDPAIRASGLRAALTVDGAVRAPKAELRLAAQRAAYGATAIGPVTATLDLAPKTGGAFDVSGTIGAHGIVLPATLPPGLIGDTIAARIAGVFDMSKGFSNVTAAAELGTATISLTGDVDLSGVAAGQYSLEISDLSPLARIGGIAAAGRASLTGSFEADPAGGTARTDISGTADDIASPDAWISAVVGRQVPFSLGVDWREGRGVDVVGLDVRPAVGRLFGDVSLGAGSGALSGRIDIAIEDLGVLSPLAGGTITGAANAAIAVGGTADQPSASASVATRGLGIDGVAADRLDMTASAQLQGRVVQGNVRLSGEMLGRTLTGGFAASADAAAATVRDLDLKLGENAVGGNLRYEFPRSVATGALDLNLPDLADLPGLDGTTVGGSASGTVRLSAARLQEIALDLKGAALTVAPGDGEAVRIGAVTVKATLRDPFAAAVTDGAVVATGIAVGPATISRATVTARGGGAKTDWEIDARGRWDVPFSVSAAGETRLSARRIEGTLSRLSGTLKDREIALSKPASFSLEGASFDLAPTALKLADGEIRVFGRSDGRSVTGDAEIENIPLSLGALFAPRLDLAGRVSGSTRISGDLRSPTIDSKFQVRGARPPDLEKSDFAGLDADLTLRQDGGEMQADVSLDGGKRFSATGSLRTGATIDLGAMAVANADAARLSGRIDMSGDLGIVDLVVGLGGDRLAGNISAKAEISGTLGRPEINGEASLTEGAYEGVLTGIVMRELAARVTFSGQEARLVSLSANDGGSGRLSGGGQIAINSGDGSGDTMSIKLEKFVALRRPEAEVTTSGELTAHGPLARPRLVGKLTIDQSEIRIPDRLPESVVDLDVVEINGSDPNRAEVATPEASVSQTIPIVLDLTVDVPGRSFVRGRGLDSEWAGTLRIAGEVAKPDIDGALRIVRGTFAFAGKTFVIKSGSVRFGGNGSLQPEIDATAEATIGDILARVTISGKASQPKIEIGSVPELPQEDVLSQILFGQSAGQLTPIQAAQLAQTAATLSGAGGSVGIMDRVRQTLGVDVLNVESSDASTRGASLKAGKYVSDKVFLSVTQGTEPGSQKVGVEVEVFPNVVVDTGVSGQGSSNVGVIWKFDY